MVHGFDRMPSIMSRCIWIFSNTSAVTGSSVDNFLWVSLQLQSNKNDISIKGISGTKRACYLSILLRHELLYNHFLLSILLQRTNYKHHFTFKFDKRIYNPFLFGNQRQKIKVNYELDCSQSSIFPWDSWDRARFTVNNGHLDFQMYIFLASSQTVPRTLRRFDTLPQVRLSTSENKDGRH